MTTIVINTIDAKEQFTDLINRVAHSKDRFILTRRGKEIAVIIPVEDFAHIQSLQDKNDLQSAIEALTEARNVGTISLENLEKE